MNIAERSQLKAMQAQLEEIASIPDRLSKALIKLDEALEDFDRRVKEIEKQHQMVLDNIQHLKDIVSGAKPLPNARRYKQDDYKNRQ